MTKLTNLWDSFWRGYTHKDRKAKYVDLAGDDSFPASDPPASHNFN